MLLLAFCSIISVIGVKVNCEERPKRDQDDNDMVRNGIFLNARHTLTDDFKPSKGPVKPSSSSIRLLRNSDRLGGLLNSTRGPREREPRLVVLPRDPVDVKDKRKQICSDEHCLAKGYDKLGRPHLGVKKPLRVGIELDGIRILEVEDQTFSVSIQMYLGVRWTEPRMSGPVKQEEEDYDYYQDYYYYFSNDSFVALDTKFVRHLWIPDLYVYNMKYGSRVLKDFDGRLFVINGNEIFYRQELIVTIWCPLRFEFYPLDHQQCTFLIGSYASNAQNIVFELDQLRMDETTANPLLEYVYLKPIYREGEVESLGIGKLGNYSLCGFKVFFKRRPFQHIINFFLPSALFVAVSWASFLIPPDLIPGRITLLVTLFLVLINIFNNVNAKSPPVEVVTSIALFVIVCILFVFGALVAYAIILQKKKKHMWKVGVLPSESTFNIYNIFQLPSLAASAFESVSRRASMTFWPNSNRNSVVSVSPSPTSAPTLPPPPPPLPSAVEDPRPESSNGLPGSVGTISGKLNLVVPKPPALPPKPTPGSIWHDKDMDFVDKVFIVVFPLSFLLFNCVFWPILINYDEIF